MLEKKSRIWQFSGSVVMTIPAEVLNDSNFPFKIERDEEKEDNPIKSIDVNVRIDLVKKRLIIEKYEEDKK